ncbi:MAG: ATP-binding cassette domain-containing protein, partial [Pseudomonadales bacterium]|nr:ATP-binding cassette domain-containing protein [Pseudomonadales bacterium]
IIVREGLTVIALFAYLIYKNPQLTLIFLILGPPLALIIRWVGVKVKRFGHGIQLTVGELNHVVSEVFSGIRLVKSSVAERQSKGRFHDVSSDTKKLGMKLAKVNSIYAPLMQMMIIVAMAIVMYVVLYFRDMMDPAALIAYVTAAALLPKPIRSLSSVHPQLLQGVVAAQEVFEHIDKEKERNTGKLSSPAIEGEIEFKDVVFFYDEESAPVLKKVSFVAPRGSTIALVGRSGGGKSTLVNLIPRFYDAGEGEIKIDGVNLREYSLDFLRKNIAIVSQNVNLFNASIADNIAFGLEQVEITEIKRAAQVANADEFIRELPDGYETMVGENGVLLSGGQRQRLAIARAILRNAPILIMDEATSALDNESEVKVQLALEKVMQDRTTLVIAHRLSTVEHADEILVLEGGEIVERGSHQQLMSRNDVYARMVQRDFMD